ncbi:type I restriction endonuclease subunit R [Candidatus Woesearchaeota archaeon]|nr:MAG: type I restriction endonuclease subunit R [Candidatus Woesearchaeota archaeon]
MIRLTEADLENNTLDLLRDIGYKIIHGPDILPDGPSPERKTLHDIVLVDRLRSALEKINPAVPKDAVHDAIKKILRTDSQNLIANNHSFHKLLREGVPVEYKKRTDIKHDTVHLIDFSNPKNNEFAAINQFTIVEERNTRRPDIILFINGLPLAVIELKNPADENATIWSAFNQIETYKEQIPSLFRFNEILVLSDGLEARAGTISSNKERFIPWKKINGENPPKSMTPLDVLIQGMFHPERFLDIMRNFIVFEAEKDKKTNTVKIVKKLAAYHQYQAVNKAIESTIKATKADKRAGIVWHTQGSGKSLVMVFYTAKLAVEDALENPTIIILTDRNDLDDQLFETFSSCHDILRQKPKQAESREEVKELLKVASGGVVFTTIQKFIPEIKGEKYPLLSNRRNIIVVADEAHRSQYDFIDGFAKHLRDALPNASFIGFTGTPIEKADKSTPAVFGKYVDVYDIEQAVEDGTTVRIYYEGRLVKLELKPEEVPRIDPLFEEVTEGEESASKEKLKSKWARLEAVVGSKNRIKRIAKDIVKHFETRLSILEGKGMIVCMSRRICVELHNEIVKLRPDWYDNDDKKGFVKVVMTGSASDELAWQEHIRNKPRRKTLADRMKDPSDPLKLVIVRDMWLTGFDAPSLHTMYLDKPMRGHGLMQAIARVNRVFKDKPGGLIVDYIGIAYELKKALAEYTEGDKRQTGIPQDEAVALLHEKYEIIQSLFHGFNYKTFFTLKPTKRTSFIFQAMDFILKQTNGKERYLKSVTELSKAFALSVPHEDALKIQDEVGFFQAVRAGIAKNTETAGTKPEDIDSAIQQIVSKAVVSDRVIDIFAAAGLRKPNVAVLSDDFLAEVKGMPHKNLAFEALKKLLHNEIRIKARTNLVQSRSFAEMLDRAIKSYTNKSIETAQVIEELIELARKMREASKEGKKLGLSEDEIAFYDALSVNDSAVQVLGDETLKNIARELVEKVRKNATIDWTIRENVQAEMRIMVKRILRKYGYPPNKEEEAANLVLEQAKLLCAEAANGH